MQKHRLYTLTGLTVLCVCALVAGGCGGGDGSTTTTTSPTASAQQKVDSAISSCSDQAQQIGGTTGSTLDGACTSVGNVAKQDLASGSENVKQALSTAANTCRDAVDQVPSGQARDAVEQLCDAIASAG
jgi:hypothetical protein